MTATMPVTIPGFTPGYVQTPYYDVTAYGAKGNGSHDDTAAIQAAIDAAPTYGTIAIPDGTFKCTGQLNVVSKRLVSTGGLLSFSGLGSTKHAVSLSGARVAASGLRILMDGTGLDGIHLADANEPLIDHCAVESATRDAIHVQPSADGQWVQTLRIRDCYLSTPGRHGLAMVENTVGSFVNEVMVDGVSIHGAGTLETGYDVYLSAGATAGTAKISNVLFARVNTDGQGAVHHAADGWFIDDTDNGAIVEALTFQNVTIEDTVTVRAGYAVNHATAGNFNNWLAQYLTTNNYGSGVLNTAGMGGYILITANGMTIYLAASPHTLTLLGTLKVGTLGAFVSGDKYVLADATGNFHISATGPNS